MTQNTGHHRCYSSGLTHLISIFSIKKRKLCNKNVAGVWSELRAEPTGAGIARFIALSGDRRAPLKLHTPATFIIAKLVSRVGWARLLAHLSWFPQKYISGKMGKNCPFSTKLG
jgi:hypothetical protein